MPVTIQQLTDTRLTALLEDAAAGLDRIAAALCDLSPDARERTIPKLYRLNDTIARLADDLAEEEARLTR